MTARKPPPSSADSADRDRRATAETLRAQAIQRHHQGDLDGAAALYRQTLAVAPEDPGALNGLGCLLHQRGESESAVALLERAAAAAPQAADIQANLGHGLAAVGRLPAAAQAYRRSLALLPGQPALWHALASLHDHLFEGDAAIAAAERVVALAPAEAIGQQHLAQLYRKEARLSEAAERFAEARRLAPDDIALAQQHAQVLAEGGQLDAAESILRETWTRQRGDAAIAEQRARLLCLQDRFDEALAIAEELLALPPAGDEARLLAAVAITQLAAGKAEAFVRLEAVSAAWPRTPDLLVARAGVLQGGDRQGEAMALLQEALAAEPGHVPAQVALGLLRQDRGEIAAARKAYAAAAEAMPTKAALRSALAVSLNYDPEAGEAALFQAARDWDARFGTPLKQAWRAHDNGAEPERRLRVGYVSPDFRRHSVAYFAAPLLEAHDRDQVEVYCYAELARLDAVSRRFEALADVWRNTTGQGDRQVAAQVRADKIDILVDLAGHTADNRLCTFALKPAPLQVTWLGYPGSSGLEAMDYRLTDAICDPPGEAERWHSERLIHLPDGFLCFRPDDSAPPVAPSPCLAKGRVTFGSFNNPAKISAPVVETWSALLRRLPETRLFLKGQGLGDEDARGLLRRRFAAQGIGAERLSFSGHLPATGDHLAAYGEVDLALDCFPYNGTTTTLEALWMGVPVVTLEGGQHAGRVGTSLMRRIGLEAFVAKDLDSYVMIAASLASENLKRLQTLRQELRRLMLASPLLDGEAFTRDLERVYREIWIAWCRAHRQVHTPAQAGCGTGCLGVNE